MLVIDFRSRLRRVVLAKVGSSQLVCTGHVCYKIIVLLNIGTAHWWPNVVLHWIHTDACKIPEEIKIKPFIKTFKNALKRFLESF